MSRLCGMHALVLIALACGGCTSAVGSVFEPARYPSERVRASSFELSLRDERSGVQARASVDTPAISWPGQEQAVALALDPGTDGWLRERLQRVLGTGTARLLALVRVVHASAGWSASAFSEEAFAEVELVVEVVDSASQRKLAFASGKASGRISSVDTSDEEVTRLFDRAIVRAFEEAVTQPAFVRLINEALGASSPRPSAGPAVAARR